jgi:TolB-like protein/Tfp pilus assembly protein PilF
VSSLSSQTNKGRELSFYTELRRRNVFKVAIVYAAVAWLLLQVSDTLGPALRLPEWFLSAVAFLLILGFPVAVIFAWAFELTPDGLKAESNADPAAPGHGQSGKNLNYVAIGALVLALGYFAIDKVALDTDGDAAGTSTADNVARQQPADIQPVEADNSIAVLPFVNMSSDAEQEYFSDGLAEELLNLLARIPELNVAARTSSFSFKDKDLPIPEIASQLNVAHVLEGSVRKHGNQLRITAQLIRADNGYHLWSETYDRQLDDVFQIQEDIAGAVVDALRITLLGEAPRIRKTDPRAYQLFLEGQYLKRQISHESLHRAIDTFKEAVEIDPAYVPAWAELADTYIWIGSSDRISREEGVALANQAIQAAIGRDPDYAFAYYVRGIWWIFSRNEFRKGIEDFEHALELDPDDAFLVAAIGKGAFLTGKYDLAISQYREALAMEPVVPEFYFFLGNAYLSSGRLDEAEASFRKLSSLSPSSPGKAKLWETLFLKGELEAALEASDTHFTRAVTQFASGNRAQADEALADLVETANSYFIAMAYGFRGDADATFEWLDKLVADGDLFPTFILTETAFEAVHEDPRWEVLLEKLGLLDFWLEVTPGSGD